MGLFGFVILVILSLFSSWFSVFKMLSMVIFHKIAKKYTSSEENQNSIWTPS